MYTCVYIYIYIHTYIHTYVYIHLTFCLKAEGPADVYTYTQSRSNRRKPKKQPNRNILFTSLENVPKPWSKAQMHKLTRPAGKRCRNLWVLLPSPSLARRGASTVRAEEMKTTYYNKSN